MKKTIIAVLAVVVVAVVAYMFITKGRGPTGLRPTLETASCDPGRPVSRPPETVPPPPVRELPTQRSPQDQAPSHTSEAKQGPDAEPSSPATEESDTVLPKDHIAWSQVYPFFLIHMLMFGVSGFLMAYVQNGPPVFFLFLHGGFAIAIYTVFYITIFGRDEVKWMFINAGLGLLGIWSQIDCSSSLNITFLSAILSQ